MNEAKSASWQTELVTEQSSALFRGVIPGVCAAGLAALAAAALVLKAQK
jgi:hypothetical protein